MGEKDREEIRYEGIPPYRMAAIMKTAARLTDELVNGKFLYSPSYQECEIVIELISEAMKKSKEEYRRK